MAIRILSSILLATLALSAQSYSEPTTRRPVATYSIVARDTDTGQFGVAVQSHWFSVGSIVTWARPGVGAVATQSFVLVDYGPNGLQLMDEGISAKDALAQLVAADEPPGVRPDGYAEAFKRDTELPDEVIVCAGVGDEDVFGAHGTLDSAAKTGPDAE